MITLGLSEIQVGDAVAKSPVAATIKESLTKIGKTYKDTCKLAQATSEVTEHYEEGKSAPEVRKKSKKMPILTFSMMDPDITALTTYVGGQAIDLNTFGMDGSEIVANKAINVKTEQGLEILIPNADIEAVINAEFSAKGILLLDFTVTPCAVESGKPFMATSTPA